MTERARATTPAPEVRQLVLGTAALMVVAQAGFRAWALYPSWFYTDDYRLLHDGTVSRFGVDYLTTPRDEQFMPVGRAVAWLVAQSGQANWPLAATLVLAMQLLAGAASVWMLVTVFGARWGVLAPLGLYLTTAITMPGLMWWAASLNQLPLQAVFFASVATWWRYARSRRAGWLVLTLLVLALGLLCYVKTLLVFGVLAFLLLAYHCSGPLHARLISAVRRYWPALVTAVALGVGFVAYHREHVPSAFRDATWTLAGDLADTMLGTALTSGLVGGPWRWDASNPPTGYADAPTWSVHAAQVLIVAVLIVAGLRRRRTGRAWLLFGGYSAAAFVIVLTTRAPVVGPELGLELRYLTDLVPVAVLCLGLVLFEAEGAAESSEPRPRPVRLRSPRWLMAGLLALVLGGGLLSSARYARIWHDDNPGDSYTHAAIDGLRGRGPVDLADQVVPATVVPGFSAPYNTTARLLPLLVDNARFPETTGRLVVLAEDGTPYRARIEPVTSSRPGPATGCGWQVTRGSVTIPMAGTAFDFTWWLRIGYLGSTDDTMTVTVAGTTRTLPVLRGAQSLFVRVTGEVSSVTLGGLSDGTTVCVETVEVGNPVPGGAL